MDINPVTEQHIMQCKEDLTGVQVNCEITLIGPRNQQGVFSQEVAGTIGQACADVYEHLCNEFEYQWTGTFRVLLTRNPERDIFEINFYYKVMIFGDYTKEDLEDLIIEIEETLSEVETVREQPLTLDFRVTKDFHVN